MTAAVVLAVIVMPLAIAGAQSQTQKAPGAKATLKQIKALRQKTAALMEEASAMQTRMKAIEARTVPASLPPHGPAGGDLTGSYPNPQIRAGAIGSGHIADNAISSRHIQDGGIVSADIADNSLLSSDIGDGEIRSADLAMGAVGSAALANTFIESGHVTVESNEREGLRVRCPGSTQLIGGGVEWGNYPPENGQQIIASYPDAEFAQSWTGFGFNSTLSDKSLTVTVICLGS